MFTQLTSTTKIILTIQVIGMMMGTFTHVNWTIQNGFFSPEYNAPIGSMIFWDSLTFLDPLAALLLIIRPRIGVLLTCVIITADIIHNNWFYVDELYINAPPIGSWITRYWMILGQIIFAVFVWTTLKRNLKDIARH